MDNQKEKDVMNMYIDTRFKTRKDFKEDKVQVTAALHYVARVNEQEVARIKS